MRGLALAVLLVLLPSCAVGPDYERPPIPTQEGFRMAEVSPEVRSIANLPWWELLRDVELQKLIGITLQENKDLKRAVASVEEFQARLLVARMDFAPQMTSTLSTPSAGRQANFLISGFPNIFNYYTQGNLSWELMSGGGFVGPMKPLARTCSPVNGTGGPWYSNW